ncbi:MAG: 6-carboxytetrahydropterin synthase QueD [Lentisphaeria bacterium]|nr:6-carboxytetrahydropterin synthase QueD [Lentisphaeria bacterium]
MFELDIHKEFSAAHSLRGYNGNCANLHGHNWTVQVFIRAEKLNEIGIAMDFKVLKKELDAVLAELDHKNLNEHPHFKETNATSENLAMYIYRRLKPAVDLAGVKLDRVRVCESPTSGATYSE